MEKLCKVDSFISVYEAKLFLIYEFSKKTGRWIFISNEIDVIVLYGGDEIGAASKIHVTK